MKDTVVVRDRGQLTIPDGIRKAASWVAPLSAVTISMVRPDEIVIRPHQSKLNTEDLWKKINRSRSIKGRGNTKTLDFLMEDRRR